MINPLELVAQQISKTDQQLLYHLILEQQETNRLLRQLIGAKEPATEVEEQQDETINMKRQELMKHIAKLENKPNGWNTWDTEKMREFVRGKQT